ncbi:TetR/AcrR family transcriptional regulator [Brachybacterium sp. SGAir0954]|uniref:TetR/AcrR family transcriptional regulator n=1 Tax=Brachybacterium sp. SGAir0954 TaxID=2571029 RepID=UPI001F119020|nr:TetR/AcrR family transcriptional regulator [Brachybacterium sp. SGAir0954]
MTATTPRAQKDVRRHSARAALEEHLATQDWSRQSASRARILDAFLSLATTRGFDAVTMRMIGREVEVKAPSLYAHFPGGKDEIVAESLRWHFHRFGTALLEVVDDDQDADAFWDAMVRLHFTRQTNLPESNLWDILVQIDRMSAIFPEALREEVRFSTGLHEALYLAAATDLGVEEPERAVRQVVALLEASTRWAEPDAAPEAEAGRAVAVSRLLLGV